MNNQYQHVDVRGGRNVELSVIIVNWNSKEFLRNCLTSMFVNDWDPAWEVVVVDNASFDGCGEMLSVDFPMVHFLQSEDNLGFAGANNFAFGHSSGKYLLFLNPDTEFVGAAVKTMLSFLRARSEAGAVGVRLLNSDLSLQTSCIQRFPTIANQILDSDILRQTFPRAALWGMAPLFRAEDTVARVDVISGACLMLTREAFEEVGHFSTNYFMYSEDVDLCYKLQARGRHNYYLGNASVVHHGGKSTASQETGFSTVVMRESKWLFLRKTRGLLYAVAYRLSVVAVALCRLAALISISVITLGAFRRRSINASYTRWRKSLSWSLGMEKWVGKLMHPSVSSTTVRVGASQQAQKATARNFD